MIIGLTVSVFQRRCQIKIKIPQMQVERLIYSQENIVLKLYLRKNTIAPEEKYVYQNCSLNLESSSNI